MPTDGKKKRRSKANLQDSYYTNKGGYAEGFAPGKFETTQPTASTSANTTTQPTASTSAAANPNKSEMQKKEKYWQPW